VESCQEEPILRRFIIETDGAYAELEHFLLQTEDTKRGESN
jgi:hypothetical protein